MMPPFAVLDAAERRIAELRNACPFTAGQVGALAVSGGGAALVYAAAWKSSPRLTLIGAALAFGAGVALAYLPDKSAIQKSAKGIARAGIVLERAIATCGSIGQHQAQKKPRKKK